MVPSTTTNSSKSLNPLAPEYHRKTPAVVPEPPQFFVSPFLPASSSAYPYKFFPPLSSLASPSFFSHPQTLGNICTYYCYPPKNPYSGPSTPLPPQVVVTNDSSAAVRPEGVISRTVGDMQPFPQVSITPPSGGFPPGVRKVYSDNGHVRRSVSKVENRHVVFSLNQEEENTTIMLKNIPYDCRREYLLEFLDRFCAKCRNDNASSHDHPEEQINASYDFLYLPIDFRTGKSRGFAFFNFTTAAAAWKFFDTFNSTEWDPLKWYRWPKKLEIARAKIQGKEALITHFSNSTFECITDEFLPVCFNPPRDGSGQHFEVTSVGKRRSIPHWEPRVRQS